MTPTPDQAVAWTVSFLCFCGAVFERIRNKKKEDQTESEKSLLSDARMFQERSEMLRKLADDNLELYKNEHADHKKTRDYWHDKASEFQNTLSKCQAQIEEFKALDQQAQTSVEILQGIKSVLEQIKQLYSALK